MSLISEKTEKVNKSMQAKHCQMNGIKFDSLSERDFYFKLINGFGVNNVSRAESRILLPSQWDDVPAISWTPDFAVIHENTKYFLEFKGTLNRDQFGTSVFMLKWAIVQGFEKAVRDKYLCFVDSRIIPKWQTRSGLVRIPSVYSNKGLTAGRIKDLVSDRHTSW